MPFFAPPPTEFERWSTPRALRPPARGIGLSAMDPLEQHLYGHALPRHVMLPRAAADRKAINHWEPPRSVVELAWQPGQIVLGKLAGRQLGYMDDRPMVTIAGARAGKTSTTLEPNLYLYPGSMVVLDPKGELAKNTAFIRSLLGHRVIVLDPFGQSGHASHSFNVIAELDPASDNIIDDVNAIAQAIIMDDGDSRSSHWNNGARTLVVGLILFTLTLPPEQRNLVTVRQLLSLTHPALTAAVSVADSASTGKDEFFLRNKAAVEALLMAMATTTEPFDGVLAAIGQRFANTPPTERGSIFSTAATQTDFLDSIPLRRISRHSDFQLKALASCTPTTIYLCLPVGRMATHSRWLRLVVQQALVTLEQLGGWPRGKTPILFMMEEFATLGHLDMMERAAAYFPGFGVKLWAVLQDITQLKRNYAASWETFLGNAGVVQCFANADQSTLEWLRDRLQGLVVPFEMRKAFARDNFAQMLMVDGRSPIAALRLSHDDVGLIRARQMAALPMATLIRRATP